MGRFDFSLFGKKWKKKKGRYRTYRDSMPITFPLNPWRVEGVEVFKNYVPVNGKLLKKKTRPCSST